MNIQGEGAENVNKGIDIHVLCMFGKYVSLVAEE